MHDAERVPRTLRAAAATGRLTLRPDAVVRRVTAGADGVATGVELVDRRTRGGTMRGRVVVLCASTIESLRILLNSGVGASSGRLGEGLVDHVIAGVGGPFEGRAQAAAADDPYDFGAVTGFLRRRRGGLRDPGRDRPRPGRGTMLRTARWRQARNRVVLHPRRTDAWGVPLRAPRVRALGRRKRALARRQLEAMRALADAAGPGPHAALGRPAGRARLPPRRGAAAARSGAFLPGTAAHEAGGAPMGASPASSVLDPWCRVWDAGNVFVTDGAAFPGGIWQNLTLTLMALTVRACEHITGELRAGRL